MRTWSLLDRMIYFARMMLSKWSYFLTLLLIFIVIIILTAMAGISFDLQLSNFGLDVDELKKPSTSRGFIELGWRIGRLNYSK